MRRGSGHRFFTWRDGSRGWFDRFGNLNVAVAVLCNGLVVRSDDWCAHTTVDAGVGAFFEITVISAVAPFHRTSAQMLQLELDLRLDCDLIIVSSKLLFPHRPGCAARRRSGGRMWPPPNRWPRGAERVPQSLCLAMWPCRTFLSMDTLCNKIRIVLRS